MIDQQDTQVCEHIDKPLVLELYPRSKKKDYQNYIFNINYRPIIIKMTSKITKERDINQSEKSIIFILTI